jgi:uncharacterized metal-binding protein YceD (DUF177 family)
LGGDITVEEFTGRVRLNRTPQGIVAQGDFSAQIPAECARCLQPFAAPVEIHLEDLFVYPPQNATDPLLAVAEDAHLNLEPLLREFVLINQPTRLLCREDCKGLCSVCGNDLNEGPCLHPEEEAPRLIPERILKPSGSGMEKPTAAPQAAKRKPNVESAAGKKAAAGKKKPSQKKPAAKAPRKTTSGGRKPSAGKRTASGGKKKPSTKK